MTIGSEGSKDDVEVRLDSGTATQQLREVENSAVISRRGVLWRAGIVTAAGAAALTGLDQQRAEAATGGNFILGVVNDAASATTLKTTSGVTLGFSHLMVLDGSTNVSVSTLDVTGAGGTAVAGHNTSGVATSGESSSGTGVAGSSQSGSGVTGTSASGSGVVGSSSSGRAMFATSIVGGGVHIEAPAFHMRLLNATTRQVPTADVIPHQRGDIVETTDGELWLCTATGTPGTWQKLGGPASAGAFHFLPTPVRIYDSRPFTSPPVGSKTPLTGNVARVLDTTVNSSGVPLGATGVMVNLLLVNAAQVDGNVTLWTNGASRPSSNTMVWGPGSGRYSTTAVTAIDAAAKLQIAASQSTNAVIDVVGYYR